LGRLQTFYFFDCLTLDLTTGIGVDFISFETKCDWNYYCFCDKGG